MPGVVGVPVEPVTDPLTVLVRYGRKDRACPERTAHAVLAHQFSTVHRATARHWARVDVAVEIECLGRDG